jgi:hypothetical protein
VGRRRLIPQSRLVRVNSEKLGNTLGVRFVDSFYNHRIAGTVSMGLWSVTQAFVLGRMTPSRGRVTPLGGELDIGTHGTHMMDLTGFISLFHHHHLHHTFRTLNTLASV